METLDPNEEEEAIMDFIDTDDGAGVLVELKYCERCGGLFVRSQGNHRVYCMSCVLQVEKLAHPRQQSKAVRVNKPKDFGTILGVAEMLDRGVWL